jgi:hypothetical protein
MNSVAGVWVVDAAGVTCPAFFFPPISFLFCFFSKSDFLIDRQLRRQNIQSERVDDGRRSFTMDKR